MDDPHAADPSPSTHTLRAKKGKAPATSKAGPTGPPAVSATSSTARKGRTGWIATPESESQNDNLFAPGSDANDEEVVQSAIGGEGKQGHPDDLLRMEVECASPHKARKIIYCAVGDVRICCMHDKSIKYADSISRIAVAPAKRRESQSVFPKTKGLGSPMPVHGVLQRSKPASLKWPGQCRLSILTLSRVRASISSNFTLLISSLLKIPAIFLSNSRSSLTG